MVRAPTGKFVAFDIETAKLLPSGVRDLKAHRPLGICCAATLPADSQCSYWTGLLPDGRYALQMDRSDAQQLVRYLLGMRSAGYTIVTWNGLGFDFYILAEESGMADECKFLALNHVDMMFQFFCQRGFLVGLEAVARGLNLPGKKQGVAGAQVPQMWAEGRHEEVLEYLRQDVITTLQVALTCQGMKSVRWITRRGDLASEPLSSGWLTVQEAMKLPQPDTSWMDNPLRRTEFTQWLL